MSASPSWVGGRVAGAGLRRESVSGGERGASGVRREPVERGGSSAGTTSSANDGRGRRARRSRPGRGRRRRARRRRAAAARWPGRGPSRAGASSSGRMLAANAAGISAPPGPGTVPSRSTLRQASIAWPAITETRFSSEPSSGLVDGRAGHGAEPVERAEQVLGEVVAGEVGARRLLGAVLGGEVAQDGLEHGERGLGGRDRGRAARGRRPTRRGRRRRWRPACSRRLEVVVPALGVRLRPAPR